MDLDLNIKRAVFRQLQELHEDANDELFDAVEVEHRARCKNFIRAVNKGKGVKTRSIFSGFSNPATVAPRRTATDPIVKRTAPTEVIVIEDTSQPKKAPHAPGSSSDAIVIDDDSAAEAVKGSSTRRNKNNSRNQLRKTSRSSPPTDDSTSATMGKRKRLTKLEMAPEAQQHFKGLSLFFIPNDDIDPARKSRIAKAREHGANWVRTLGEATHVIVDSRLTSADIRMILDKAPTSLDLVVVNDEYLFHCISQRRLLNANRKQFRVQDGDTSEKLTTNRPGSTKDSQTSLKVKSHNAGRRSALEADATPSRSDESTQRSTQLSSGRVITKSQLGSQGRLAASGDLGPSDERAAVSGNEETADAPIVDELLETIEYLRENPGIVVDSEDEHEESRPSTANGAISDSPAPDQSDSEDAGSRKRKRTTRSPKNELSPDWQSKFACMQGGTRDGLSDNPNAYTISKLQELCDYYDRNGVQWRPGAYGRAINVLRKQQRLIATAEEAKAFTGIGGSLAAKIEEIVKTGRLKKLEAQLDDPNNKVRELFLKIYDVGLHTAEKWISQGYRSLEDLLGRADLSKTQRIGVEHYDDFNSRIPRAEVKALGTCVKRAAANIDSRVELLIGGSYRRGSDSSGDIDFIITRKGTTSTADLVPFLDELVGDLTQAGFLTAGLATSRREDGSKWHGCCVLPESDFPGNRADYKPTWRRIDLLLVPETEFGAALIYFTGNDLFNRSLRLLASKKDMRLNQKGLYRDVVRGDQRERINDGFLVEGRDEKEIFKALGVSWREPNERWC